VISSKASFQAAKLNPESLAYFDLVTKTISTVIVALKNVREKCKRAFKLFQDLLNGPFFV
jgi:hypothetical protein